MKNIKIICDGIANMPKDIASQYDIHEIPLTINIDGTEYKSNEIDNVEFYEMMQRANEIPKTSQATYVDFKDVFEKYLNEGNIVLYISGSSKISGTYQSSMLAKVDIEGELYIFDSMNISFGCGLLVLEAARMAKEGKDLKTILERLEFLRDRVHVNLSPGTLEYLKKGGRIPVGKAIIGEVLNIKPVLAVKDGVIISEGQVRGSKKVPGSIIEYTKKACGVDYSDKTVAIAYGNNPDVGMKLKELVEKELNPKEIITLEISPSICVHTGPDVVGLTCFKEV